MPEIDLDMIMDATAPAAEEPNRCVFISFAPDHPLVPKLTNNPPPAAAETFDIEFHNLPHAAALTLATIFLERGALGVTLSLAASHGKVH
jgi:hypothetical protein